MTLEIVSTSSEDTEQLGEQLGSRLKGGELIELISDLGGGKTTFVRGLARGMGSQDHVSSPTFKISNVYKANRFELHHFDFYRLNEAGIIADELAEVINQPDAVIVVEWGEIMRDVLQVDKLTIYLSATAQTLRTVSFTFPDHLLYLVENLAKE